MIFASYLISAILFPSLIIYKPLPGKYFEHLAGDSEDHQGQHQITAVAWLGAINVGSFLIFNGLGALFTNMYARPEKYDMKLSHSVSYIALEFLFCVYILWVTLKYLHNDKAPSQIQYSISMLVMFGLAFLHGFISSYFMTKKPDLEEIQHCMQAQAYVWRSCLKYFGICLGIIV